MPFISTIHGFVSVSGGGGGAAEYDSQQQEGGGGGAGSGDFVVTYDHTTDGYLQLLYTLDDPNIDGTPANDAFGNSVDISESYSLVGANGEDDGSNQSSGVLYLYDNADGTLSQTIENPNNYGTKDGDQFGGFALVTEDYVIGASLWEDSFRVTSRGVVYVFDPTTGNRLRTFVNPDNEYTTYGRHLAISGNLLAVSSHSADSFSGKVHVYDITELSNGGLKYTITNPNTWSTPDNDQYGVPAISSQYLAVAAYTEDQGGSNSGIVYLYDTETGNFLREIDNPNFTTPDNDYFGLYMEIENNWLIVGVSNENKAYVYDLNDENNTIHAILELPEDIENSFGGDIYAGFGTAVDISGKYAIVGSGFFRDTTPQTYGVIYIYDLSNGGALVQRIAHPNQATRAGSPGYFGAEATRFHHDKLICGDKYEDIGGFTRAGRTYVFGPGGTDNGLTP